MREHKLIENAAAVGSRLAAGLREGLAGVVGVIEIRGQGLMLGIALDRPCGVLLGRAAQAGLLISVTAETVIRLLPALILTAAEADQMVAILIPLIRDFLAEPKA
jgi:acetylornithine aminotransferase